MSSQAKHQPVLLNETIQALEVKPGYWYIDSTFGRGGHTKAILEQGGNVIAFDHDEQAINFGQKTFVRELEQKRLILVRENFAKLDQAKEVLIKNNQLDKLRGILFDFGTSVDQLTNALRGFSFEGEGELDMRMDDRLGVKAKDLLAVLSEKQLADVFFRLGGETKARQIAKAIVSKRNKQPIQTTQELTNIIEQVVRRSGRLHPATKVFQALRIAVNDELTNIELALPKAINLVQTGVVITIAFHEGEDRIAKQFFKEQELKGVGHMEDLVTPAQEEINNNPRSRSAKMRIFRKN